MALRRGAPLEFYNHAGANCSPGNPDPAPERNPDLKHTQIGAIYKKFHRENDIKIKNQRDPEYFKLQFYSNQ
jgi:hypothetical protein